MLQIFRRGSFRAGVVLALFAILTGLLTGEIATATPVHATGSACAGGDQHMVPFQDDDYRIASWLVHDSYPQGSPTHTLNMDLVSYHATGNDGHCYQAYYSSVWCDCGAWMQAKLRVWVCGQGPAQWQTVSHWDTRMEQDSAPWPGAGFTLATQTPGGLRNLDYFDYGAVGYGTCGPQADNLGTNACSSTWDTCVSSDPGWHFGFMYLQI